MDLVERVALLVWSFAVKPMANPRSWASDAMAGRGAVPTSWSAWIAQRDALILFFDDDADLMASEF